MPEILALLQNIAPLLEKTTFRQMSRIVYGMLVASGRITMLGLSRWTEEGEATEPSSVFIIACFRGMRSNGCFFKSVS
jgi:hypothetical protein